MEFMDFSQFVVGEALILIPVLVIVGLFLKNIPNIPDWLIPLLLGVVGVALSFGLFGSNVNALVQGILAAGAAVYSHQLFKQFNSKD